MSFVAAVTVAALLVASPPAAAEGEVGMHWDPAPVRIGEPTHQQLGAVTVSNVHGLPSGLHLSSSGLLTGTAVPQRAGSHRVTADVIDGDTRGPRTFTIELVGGQLDHVTRTWSIEGKPFTGSDWVNTPYLICPAAYPWTINEDRSSRPMVPHGITTVTNGAGMAAQLSSAWDQGDRAVGAGPGGIKNFAWWGTADLYFVLHCTNDLNRARLR